MGYQKRSGRSSSKNEDLKAKITALNSTLIEVDGLRFVLNGDVISTPELESNSTKNSGSSGALTMTQTFDNKGRLSVPCD